MRYPLLSFTIPFLLPQVRFPRPSSLLPDPSPSAPTSSSSYLPSFFLLFYPTRRSKVERRRDPIPSAQYNLRYIKHPPSRVQRSQRLRPYRDVCLGIGSHRYVPHRRKRRTAGAALPRESWRAVYVRMADSLVGVVDFCGEGGRVLWR